MTKVFGKSNQNLQPDQLVIIGATNSQLDGMVGQIVCRQVGTQIPHLYAVLFDSEEPVYEGFRTLMVTEVCLLPMVNIEGEPTFGKPIRFQK